MIATQSCLRVPDTGFASLFKNLLKIYAYLQTKHLSNPILLLHSHFLITNMLLFMSVLHQIIEIATKKPYCDSPTPIPLAIENAM